MLNKCNKKKNKDIKFIIKPTNNCLVKFLDITFCLSLSLSAVTKPIPEGYEYRQGLGYYKFHTDRKSWNNAKLACEDEGAYLAVINSDAEAQALRDMFPVKPEDYAHIGFYDSIILHKNSTGSYRVFVTLQGKQ